MTVVRKLKSKALLSVPQDREAAVWSVGRIGTLRRDIAAKRAAADESIRQIGEAVEAAIAPLVEELKVHEEGLQAYCEVNRSALTNGDKVKFHDFGTGRISWRMRPPRVVIRCAEAVIEACKRLGRPDFVRVREEINKDAMLADPDTARGIAGIRISSEGEDFLIEPVEVVTTLAKG